MVIMTQKQVADLKRRYPPGTRIVLTERLNDPQPIMAGEKGTVSLVDGAGQIHVKWDCGRGLALVPGVDSFKIED